MMANMMSRVRGDALRPRKPGQRPAPSPLLHLAPNAVRSGPVRRSAGMVTRLKVRLRRARLDHDLADGCAPDTSALHVARAGQLMGPTVRAKVSASLRRIVDDADQPYGVLIPVALHRSPVLVSLRQDEVRASREGLLRIARQLEGRAAVSPCGVARAVVLLSDGAGPLYHDAPRRRLPDAISQINHRLGLSPGIDRRDRTQLRRRPRAKVSS
jgi:hypothetical protein